MYAVDERKQASKRLPLEAHLSHVCQKLLAAHLEAITLFNLGEMISTGDVADLVKQSESMHTADVGLSAMLDLFKMLGLQIQLLFSYTNQSHDTSR